MINTFIFTCVDPETYHYYHYYFADQPTRDNTLDCLYHKKLSFLHLTASTLELRSYGTLSWKKQDLNLNVSKTILILVLHLQNGLVNFVLSVE